MQRLISKRLLLIVPMLFIISILSFVIIQLPPGDYVETYIENLRQMGGIPFEDAYHLAGQLRERYALDKPLLVQYFIWMRHIVTKGDFGNSFTYDRPVTDMLWERVPRTMAITLAGVLLSWLIAVPIGIYSAVHQYSFSDYVFTFLGFVGLSFPAFLFAIVLVFIVFQYTGWAITGIFSSAFEDAPWSLAKFWDMLKNMTIPMIVLSTSGAAALIRILRATLLDELKKQYVITARSKGLREMRLLFKYPRSRGDQPPHQHHRVAPACGGRRRDRGVPGAEPAHDRPHPSILGSGPGHVPGRRYPVHPKRPNPRGNAHLRHPAGGGGSENQV